MDGTELLCRALYSRKARPADYLGGADAQMLYDAAEQINRMRPVFEAAMDDYRNDRFDDLREELSCYEACRAYAKATKDGGEE